MTEAQWIGATGLVLDIAGAVILSKGLMVSTSEAIDLGVMRLSGDTPEENLKLPAVRDRIKQARDTRIGLALLVAGFFLQLVGIFV